MKAPEKIEMMVSSMMMDHKPDKEEWGALNASFENITLEPLDMTEVICSGRSYTAIHNGRRGKENWLRCQYVSVDLEKHADAALDAVEDNPFFATYGYLSYTTMSHTPEAPRSRALFILPRCIDNVEAWHYGARAITAMFGEAADKASSDISRSFLGNKAAECRVYGKFLPMDLLLMMSTTLKRKEDEERTRQRAKYEQKEFTGDASSLLDSWLRKLGESGEGNRNNMLNKVAFMAGKFLVAKGRMSESDALATLVNAGESIGLEREEVFKTVCQSLAKGKRA